MNNLNETEEIKEEEYDENCEENDYYVDDEFLMQLHKRFIEMKKYRKKAEQDANLLGNRMKLLKGEEEKTWKKIENTRKKAIEKVTNLKKLEEELMKKQELKEKNEIEKSVKKDQNLKMRSEIEYNIKTKRELKMMQIIEEARLLKEQKRVISDEIYSKMRRC